MIEFEFWSYFLLAVGSGFTLWEGSAIATGHPERTLTYKIREWLGIYPVKPWRIPASISFIVVILGLTGWFLPHIVLGWWGGQTNP